MHSWLVLSEVRATWIASTGAGASASSAGELTTESPDLLVICISAFVAVFVLLGLLALVMRLLIAVYPERSSAADAAVIAAITAAVSAVHPRSTVTGVQEEK